MTQYQKYYKTDKWKQWRKERYERKKEKILATNKAWRDRHPEYNKEYSNRKILKELEAKYIQQRITYGK